MFLSDNGGCAEFLREDGIPDSAPRQTRLGDQIRVGNHAGLAPGPESTWLSYDRPWANASCTPFRLYKHYTHEGGISTPFIAHWPGIIEPGAIGHQPAWVGDFMPTFLDVAGGKYPSEYEGNPITPVRGESFLPALTGGSVGRQRPIFWEHEDNRAVRHGRWKLVAHNGRDWELYDLVRDRTELCDLAAVNRRQRDSMVDAYQRWAERVGVSDWNRLIAMPQAARYREWL